MAISHGDSTRNVMCDAVVDQIDLGANNGFLWIYESADETGTPPSDSLTSGNDNPALTLTDDATPAPGSGTFVTRIAALEFSPEAFYAAGAPNADGTVGGRVGTAHAKEVAEDQTCVAGTANWFEIVDGNTPPNMILQGRIAIQDAPEADIGLTSLTIADDDTIAIRNLSYTCAP